MKLNNGVEVEAIQVCDMNEDFPEDGPENSLTIGKKYIVHTDGDETFYVMDDQNDPHYFGNAEEWDDFFKEVPTKSSYQQDALRTESTVFNMEDGDARLLHAGIGLATESGEFLDALKKHVFYGKPLDRTNLKEEVGDLMWYCAIALDELDSTFSEVQDTNIAKLRARYPDKFTEERAETRDLVKEREILEK